MGYESSGTGIFSLRDSSKESEAVAAVEEAGFEVQKQNDGTYEIRFNGIRLYSVGKYMKTVTKYFNGEFEIEGDEKDDLWKLEFRDNRAFKRMATITITYGEPVETDLSSPEWN
jgi:hypothetical protein